MAFLATALPSILGGIFGAFGGSGKQGSSTTQQNQRSTQQQQTTNNQDSSQTQNINQLQKAMEDPQFAQFRTSLLPQIQQQINGAQQPLYGEADKANYVSNLNDLTKSATDSLRSSLASRGISDSGAAATAEGNIQMGRAGNIANFFSQIPGMNRQYKDTQTQAGLGLAANLAGRAPISTQTTGNNTATGNVTAAGTMNNTGTVDMTGKTTEEGPGFWKNLASNMGGILSGGGFQMPTFGSSGGGLKDTMGLPIFSKSPINFNTLPSAPIW